MSPVKYWSLVGAIVAWNMFSGPLYSFTDPAPPPAQQIIYIQEEGPQQPVPLPPVKPKMKARK